MQRGQNWLKKSNRSIEKKVWKHKIYIMILNKINIINVMTVILLMREKHEWYKIGKILIIKIIKIFFFYL
jgi:hypothetical protein